jgi:maleate isomerase
VVSIGVLTPHRAPGPEVELPEMARGRVATRIARIAEPGVNTGRGTGPRLDGLRELATLPALEAAAAAFGPGSVDVIGYASTSSAYAIGFDAETAMVAELSQRLGVPAVSSSAAAVRAMRTLEVERVALVHPPWFDADVNETGAAYFRSQGLTVVSSVSADLPNDPSRIETDGVVEWVSRNVDADADAIFIGGNGFRAAGAIESLEAGGDRVVLESNQVLLWSLLAAVGAGFAVRGYGRLFARASPRHV